MAIAGLNLGIDLGSANTAVCLPGQGVALREASYVLTLEQNENEVLAIGDDAKALLGRTAGGARWTRRAWRFRSPRGRRRWSGPL